jgi:hypothetical protein
MYHFLPSRLDSYFRRHPRVMMACVIALAVLVTLLLITQTTREIVVYEAF